MNEVKMMNVAMEALIKDIKRTEYAKGFYAGALLVVGYNLCKSLKKGDWKFTITKDKPEEN